MDCFLLCEKAKRQKLRHSVKLDVSELKELIDRCYEWSIMNDTYDDEEALCCCQYVSSSGERRHLVQLCCDCAELDEAVDRLVSGRAVPDGRADKVLNWHFVIYKVMNLLVKMILRIVRLHGATYNFMSV